MQKTKSPAGILGVAFAVAAAAISFIGSAPAANAAVTANSIGALRLGVFTPTNAGTRRTYGNYYFIGGLDYTFSRQGLSDRSNISVDYFENTYHGHQFQVIPVTIGQQMIQGNRQSNVHEYVGYGIGAYFTHFKNPGYGGFDGSNTHNQVAFGGFLNAGLDLSSNLFLDARYHIVTPVKDINTDGLEVTLGVRF